MFSYSLSRFRGAYSFSFVVSDSKIPPPSSKPVALLPKPISLLTCLESSSFIGRITGPRSFSTRFLRSSNACWADIVLKLPPCGMSLRAASSAAVLFSSVVSSSETTRPWLSVTTTARSPSAVFTPLYPSAACSTVSLAPAAITSSTICLLVETIVPRPGTNAA